jgi:hypothetical protein
MPCGAGDDDFGSAGETDTTFLRSGFRGRRCSLGQTNFAMIGSQPSPESKF